MYPVSYPAAETPRGDPAWIRKEAQGGQSQETRGAATSSATFFISSSEPLLA